MDRAAFAASPSGCLVPTIDECWAFNPHKLPPRDLDLTPLLGLTARASQAMGELNGIGRSLGNPHLLIRPLQRREAVSSSSMEGTHTTLSDLLLLEAGAAADRPEDTREVLNHVRALEHAIRRLPELPISRRLLCETHEQLMSGIARHRGSTIAAGELKRDQNWIGGGIRIKDARFVPPPPAQAAYGLGELEKYINRPDREDMPALIDAALAHYQFETIRPFSDGNGRIGRILVTLMLQDRSCLTQPLLYMSPFLESRKDTYIDLMFRVSMTGDWMAWIAFFLEAVVASSEQAVRTVGHLLDLQKAYRERFQVAKRSALLLRIVDLAFERPALSIAEIARALGVTYQGALNNINIMLRDELVREVPNSYPKIVYFPKIISVVQNA